MGFLSDKKLHEIGFKHVGLNVKISEKASIYNPQNISIGNNTRIDDFCILSAGKEGIEIGSYVHISCYVSLIGTEKIVIKDFVALSTRVAVFSSNDDYSGDYMANATIPDKYKNVTHASVILERHVLVGSGTIILPGVTLGIGSAVGALSLVKNDTKPFWIYGGVPARQIKKRSDSLLKKEKLFLSDLENING